jgi:hypothetical protein
VLNALDLPNAVMVVVAEIALPSLTGSVISPSLMARSTALGHAAIR